LDNFSIFFRERRMSWVILSGQVGTGRLLMQSLGERLHRQEYLLTAMDGETFGHHRPGLEQLLFEIYRDSALTTVTISELMNKFPHRSVSPIPSTWALMEKDLEEKKPFSRWYDEDNDIHKLQWQLTNLAINEMAKVNQSDPGYTRARELLDKAIHSDQYWWASARPWWSVEMIERGAKELYDTVLAIPSVTDKIKEQAKHLYHSIIFTAFDWQRSGLVDELAHREDEDVRQRVDAGLPQLPRAEVDKMVKRLEDEMKLTASRQEFERAAQIRDRIAELKRYAADVDAPKASAEGGAEWNG
jgi:UvrB/uvrC motif